MVSESISVADQKIYQGVTGAAFGKLRAGLERAHVTLPAGNSGTISSKGMQGTFAYDEAAQTLTLKIEKHPMLIPKAMLWAGIERALAEAQRA